ncbi:MAG: hypothetical protein EXR58_00210 [Chloroflexi bacterium]|nr:hypothetical protein [Chloroflexota bacterium]
MIYWGHRLGTVLTRWFPLWLTYGIAATFSPLVFLIWRDKRERAIENMLQVLGPGADRQAARRLALRSFVNYGKYVVDMLCLGGGAISIADRRLTVDGWEHLDAAFQKGKGIVFIGGHIGNSDLGAALIAQRGYPVNVIADPLSPPRWDQLVQQARQAAGLRVIPMGSAIFRSLRVLRERQVLALLLDRPTHDQGVTIEFFGRRTRVPGGAAALAVRSGASVVGGYIVRSGNRYVAAISPEISRSEDDAGDDEVQILTQRLFSWLEQVIRKYPDQWFMFRSMWPSDA